MMKSLTKGSLVFCTENQRYGVFIRYCTQKADGNAGAGLCLVNFDNKVQDFDEAETKAQKIKIKDISRV